MFSGNLTGNPPRGRHQDIPSKVCRANYPASVAFKTIYAVEGTASLGDMPQNLFHSVDLVQAASLT